MSQGSVSVVMDGTVTTAIWQSVSHLVSMETVCLLILAHVMMVGAVAFVMYLSVLFPVMQVEGTVLDLITAHVMMDGLGDCVT